HLAIPKIGPAFEKWSVFHAHRGLPEGAVSCILKRAHHAGDVAQGGPLQLPLTQRPGRLAFKIQNNEIFSGIKNLTEMIIAMDADLGGVAPAIEKTLFLGEDAIFGSQDLGGLVAESVR